MSDNDDILYEDLYENNEGKIISEEVSQLKRDLDISVNKCEKLESHVKKLKEEKKKLCQINKILVQNISCLFSTAKLEIQRKDDMIKSLKSKSLR